MAVVTPCGIQYSGVCGPGVVAERSKNVEGDNKLADCSDWFSDTLLSIDCRCAEARSALTSFSCALVGVLANCAASCAANCVANSVANSGFSFTLSLTESRLRFVLLAFSKRSEQFPSSPVKFCCAIASSRSIFELGI